MKDELMDCSYEQIINGNNIIELIIDKKLVKMNIIEKSKKKAFIVNMIDHFKLKEDYDKCYILNEQLKNI